MERTLRPYGEYSPAYPGRNRDITATIGQTPETRKGSSTKNEEIQRKIRWIEQLEQINQSKSEAQATLSDAQKYKPKHKPSQSGYSRWKASKAAVFLD